MDVLKERSKIYRSYFRISEDAQLFKRVLRLKPNWSSYSYLILESLDMICTKIVRSVNGDPHYLDNYIDIAGYAQLILDNNCLPQYASEHATVRDRDSLWLQGKRGTPNMRLHPYHDILLSILDIIDDGMNKGWTEDLVREIIYSANFIIEQEKELNGHDHHSYPQDSGQPLQS